MRRTICCQCFVALCVSSSAQAEFSLESGIEATHFLQNAAYGQSAQENSVRLQADFNRHWNDEKDLFSFIPFYRYDAFDDKRTHADIRELSYIHAGDEFEARVGIHKVFWGVTEGEHLVDIINQTDLVEDVDGKQKLGQPMLNLSTVQPWGTLDVFYLLGFRDRTFPGKDGRPRYPLIILADDALYQSADKKHRNDSAIRWQKQFNTLNVAISYFSGTDRDPSYIPTVKNSEVFLRPYYAQIHQWGFEGQFITGDWAWKLEAINRNDSVESFRAYDTGFEYTQVGVLDTGCDIGWIIEYLRDSRANVASSYFEHDFLFAARFSFNDAASSDALLSIFVDQHTQETFVNFEASRRLKENLKLKGSIRLFTNSKHPQSAADVISNGLDTEYKFRSVSQDDYARLELIYYW